LVGGGFDLGLAIFFTLGFALRHFYVSYLLVIPVLGMFMASFMVEAKIVPD
jgi:hypothetical protein